MNSFNVFAALTKQDSFIILLWLLLAFLLGLWLGYILWGRHIANLRAALATKESELSEWIKRYTALEAEFKTSQSNLVEAHKEIDNLKAGLRKYSEENGQIYSELLQCKSENEKLSLQVKGGGNEAAVKMAAAAPTPVAEKRVDDLKIVEGIGPKIEKLLNDDGIFTWLELANAPVERIQQILDNAGPNYKIHNPATWGKQAQYAHDGLWDELKEYQDFLIAGRNPD